MLLERKFSVLIGTPIRQKPTILREFLQSLELLENQNCEINYLFIDDNVEEESKSILKDFCFKHESKCLVIASEQDNEIYEVNETSHVWNEKLINKISEFKDKIIEFSKENHFDYLFLLDSDLILHPKTLDQLIRANKDIISTIFWTDWERGNLLLPQVVSLKEKGEYFSFLLKMRTPGVHPVDVLGGCTLMSKNALAKDLSFKKMKTISHWQEDYHFSVRASSLGLSLYVDTHYPAFHIYRESELVCLENFKRSFSKPLGNKFRLTLSMVVKNEASRYLRRVLESTRNYITDAVIIDDASTDNTVEICEEVLKGIPLKIVRNKESLFSYEVFLRKQQWEETIQTNPDWIVSIDSDQIFEDSFASKIHELIANPNKGDVFYCSIYDFWDENHYRQDQWWEGSSAEFPFLMRYRPDIPYFWWENLRQHCSRFPPSIGKLVGSAIDCRVKHYGWATEEDRKSKYQRYQLLDPEAKYGKKGEYYTSILDPNPTLFKWME